jgi:hypothetical protein
LSQKTKPVVRPRIPEKPHGNLSEFSGSDDELAAAMDQMESRIKSGKHFNV